MNKKKILTALAAVLCCAAMFSSCNKVNPETELLNFNPLLQWGCSLADVERHIQGKDWWQDGNDQPEYWEELSAFVGEEPSANTGKTPINAGTNGIGWTPPTKSPSSTSSRPRTAGTCAMP